MQSDHSGLKDDPPLRAAILKRPRGGYALASLRARATPDKSSESGDNAGDLPRHTSMQSPASAKVPQLVPLPPGNRAPFGEENSPPGRLLDRHEDRRAFLPGILQGIHIENRRPAS